MKRLFSILTLLFILSASLCLPAGADDTNAEYTTLAELAGKRIGVRTGTVHETYALESIENPVLMYYSGYADMAIALRENKIDAFLLAELVAKIMLRSNPTLTYIDEAIAYDDTAFAFSKNESGEKTAEQMNEFLALIKTDGTLDALTSAWLDGGADTTVKDMSALSGENGVLHCATAASIEPCSYAVTDGIIGLDIDLIYAFCEKYGYGMQLDNVDLTSILAGLSTGVYDIGFGGIVNTEERKQSAVFSDSYMSIKQIAMVRQKTDAVSADGDFWRDLADSFERTFITESRWKLVVSGLGVTLLLSVLSALFGTLFGFGLCMVRRSKSRIASAAAAFIIRLVQGIPVLVLLMTLYYIVFASSDIGGIAVATIGFSVNFGVYVSEIIRTGIDAVDKGQWEASDALGFRRTQTFFGVIIPQALKHILPVYKGEFISMVKMTSVVGYIAIQDLTKVSDIIRSRTYEAFFPLLATAAIYFVLAWLLTLILAGVEKRVNPKYRKRILKGVTTE